MASEQCTEPTVTGVSGGRVSVHVMHEDNIGKAATGPPVIAGEC